MTLGLDSQNLDAFLPVYDVIPQKWEDARDVIVEMLKQVTNGVNIRVIGWYLDEELLTGKAFIPSVNLSGNQTPSQYRQVLRLVVVFGQLPNATVKSVPHGITVDSNFTLVQMYAAATDPVNLIAFPIPYDSAGTASGVALYMDATNIYIRTESNRTSYTRCNVIVEYLQEL